jgi:predicted AAA+ superfamily ATPase
MITLQTLTEVVSQQREFCVFYSLIPSAETFSEYINKGGFPEYLWIGDPNILQTLLIDILMRDIIVRNGLRDERFVKELALYLITNSAKEFSYNSLKNIFGTGSVNTIISILNHFADSYLFFTVQQFNFLYKKRIVAPKKIYSIDTGMLTVNSSSFSADYGRILENSVFLHLKRKGEEIFYFKDGKECDFITRSKNGLFTAIQVCYELTETNLDRELNGLVEALKKLSLESGQIVTHNQTDQFLIDGKTIDVVPAWKWME